MEISNQLRLAATRVVCWWVLAWCEEQHACSSFTPPRIKPASNKKGQAHAMKVLNDVDFIDALRYAATSYRTMLTDIWGSMITAMPQHWLDNLADQDYFAPALMPVARPVDRTALLNSMTNAPYVETDAHGSAFPSTVTGYYDPSDLMAITTLALTAAEISAISANNAPAPPAARAGAWVLCALLQTPAQSGCGWRARAVPSARATAGYPAWCRRPRRLWRDAA